MRYLVLSLLFLVACGSNALNVRSLDSGSLSDRYLHLAESQFALVAKSSSAADAVARIEAYCDREAASIEKLRQDGSGLNEAEVEAFGMEIAPRLEKLVKRAEAELESKVHILSDPSVLKAMAACAPADFMGESEL